MRISQLPMAAVNSRQGTARAGNWSAEFKDGRLAIFHYTTLMAWFSRVDEWGDVWKIGNLFHGWASVSDTQGMNQILRELWVPKYFSRKWAKYLDTEQPGRPPSR